MSIVSWAAITLESGGIREPARLELILVPGAAGGKWNAEVSFLPSALERVAAAGDSELDAIVAALRLATARLTRFRMSGGQVLQDTGGFGLHPIEEDLEIYFQSVLTRYGLPRDLEVGEIVGGPSLRDTGDVVFDVKIGEHTVEMMASPLGVGCRDSVDSHADIGMRTVFDYLRQHRAEETQWYRDAGRLRRTAGNPPPFAVVKRPDVRVRDVPRRTESYVEFELEGTKVPLRVVVFPNGALVDYCNDWSALAPDDREAAIGAVLDYVFENPDAMRALGLDAELFRDLYL